MSFNANDKPEIDIFTDVEPDDVLALIVLARAFRFRAVFVVGSENPLWPRRGYLERLFDALGSKPALLLSIGEDGQPVAASLSRLETHFATAPRRLLLSLASFEPLVELYRHAPRLLASLDVVGYGSVNIRWALRRSPEHKALALRMLNEGFIASRCSSVTSPTETRTTPSIRRILRASAHSCRGLPILRAPSFLGVSRTGTHFCWQAR